MSQAKSQNPSAPLRFETVPQFPISTIGEKSLPEQESLSKRVHYRMELVELVLALQGETLYTIGKIVTQKYGNKQNPAEYDLWRKRLDLFFKRTALYSTPVDRYGKAKTQKFWLGRNWKRHLTQDRLVTHIAKNDLSQFQAFLDEKCIPKRYYQEDAENSGQTLSASLELVLHQGEPEAHVQTGAELVLNQGSTQNHDPSRVLLLPSVLAWEDPEPQIDQAVVNDAQIHSPSWPRWRTLTAATLLILGAGVGMWRWKQEKTQDAGYLEYPLAYSCHGQPNMAPSFLLY